MLPKIVIVGRPNVGKSSLLNMLAGRRVSIVEPTAGVTRDRIATIVELPAPDRDSDPLPVEMIDTGGYGVEDIQNLTSDIERQIATGLKDADVVLFLIDAQAGVVPLDQTVAQLIRSTGSKKPVLCIANKVDSDRYEAGAYEAASLGFGDPVLFSAKTKHNQHELYEAIYEQIDLDAIADREEDATDEGIRLAIVGKRNAGKSTLTNAMVGEDRVIVSDQEGTTRDAVDVRFNIGMLDEGRGNKVPVTFTAIDTAGVRKRKSIQDDIEYYSLHRALRSVRRADVCLLVIDATLKISQVDHQLAQEIAKHYRPVVIVVNKWDLVDPEKADEEDYADYLDRELKAFRYAPIVFTSALNEEGVTQVLAMAENLYRQARSQVTTSELNKSLEDIMSLRQPRSRGGKRAKVFFASQVGTDPPALVLNVNDATIFDNNYTLFMMNRLREALPYSEVPIKLTFRGKEKYKDRKGKD